MSLEWIDIVDTSVKIGLGALISGWASLSINKMKYEKESEKQSKVIRRELILVAIEKSDEYFKFLSEYYARLDGARKTLEKYGSLSDESWADLWKFVRRSEDDLLYSRNCYLIASSRLQLLGMSKALKYLNSIGTLEDEIRQFYIVNSGKKEVPSLQFLNKWHDKITEDKTNFHKVVSSDFLSKCC